MASYNFFNIKFGKHGGTSHANYHTASRRDKSRVVFTRIKELVAVTDCFGF